MTTTLAQSYVDPATGDVQPTILLADQYELDFFDEFNDASIDLSKWTVDVSGRSRSPRPDLSIAD